MATTTLVTKCHSHNLVLALLFLTTVTSSLGVQSSSPVVDRQGVRRQSVIDGPFDDRYSIAAADETPDVASSPPWRRVPLGLARRESPASAAFQNDVRAADTTLSADEKQFPVKRRWNSGNLRVWGKRFASLPITGTVGRLYGWRQEEPLWLPPARPTDNQQAPAWYYIRGVLPTRNPMSQPYRRRRVNTVWSRGTRHNVTQRHSSDRWNALTSLLITWPSRDTEFLNAVRQNKWSSPWSFVNLMHIQEILQCELSKHTPAPEFAHFGLYSK